MNTKYVWGILGIVALVLVVWIATGNKSPISGPSASATPNVSATPVAGAKAPTPKVSNAVPSVAVPPSNLSYGEAIKVYAGTRIQFNAQCQASPSTMTIKNGQSVMFDNRSGDARWFSLNGTGYYIAGYGFRILPLSSKTLPITYSIDCGSAQNVGSITVQK